MTDTPQLSGRDLARQALAAYKATARTAPTTTPARAKTRRTDRTRSGRDPITLASAITGLGADIPLEAGLAGGNVIDQWATLCPQYAGLIQPIHYDDRTGRLDLRPGSHAYAAQLRLLGGQLAEQINDKMGRPVVRTIRVLPVGAIAGVSPGVTPPPDQRAPDAPVKTRADAHPGYRDALAVVLEHKPELRAVDPYVERAMRRQEAALRAGRAPESEHREALLEAERIATSQVDRSEASRRAAIARKRAEQGGGQLPRPAFDTR